MPSDIDAASLTVALLALGLSLGSLGWQTVTFFLSGSRLRCELLMGAVNPLTRTYMTQPVASWEGLTQDMRRQGFSEERVFIVARNKGRSPVSVDAFRIVSNTAQKFGHTTTEAWEEKLPKRLEAEASAMWSLPADLVTDAVALIQAAAHIARTAPKGVLEVRAEVESGSGKTVTSTESLKFPAVAGDGDGGKGPAPARRS